MTADTSATGAETDTAAEVETEPTLAQKLAAETIGTFILVLFGCGSVVFAGIFAAQQENPRDISFITTVGLTFGISIIVAVYAFGRISGGHFNPAVSVGAAISGRIAWVTAGFYAVAQIVGAIIGALALWVFAHGYQGFSSTHLGLGQNGFGGDSGFRWWAAFLLELILTAVFVYVILGSTDERNPYVGFAPLAIGLTLTAIHFVAIPADGTSVNPARSIGPALFSGGHAIGQLWLFILAPLIGGAFAGLTYPLVFGRVSDPVPGSGLVLPAKSTAGTTPEYAGWGQQGWAGTDTGAHQPVPQLPGDLPVIEQDGWRWDYAAQQWRPIEPPLPPTPQAPPPGSDEPEGKTVIKQDPPPQA